MTELSTILGSFLSFYQRELIALLLTLPRIHAFFAASQLLNPSSVPRLSRNTAILVLAMVAVPINLAAADQFSATVPGLALLFAKEYVLGFLLGYAVGWVFWAVQAVGALIDNQRGAAIAASIDPLQGQETSPLGIMLSQVFLTYVFASGAIFPIIGLIYQSYRIWPAGAAMPAISPEFPAAVLALADEAFAFVILLGGPIVAVMFLAEFALAMVSRFAPQIQVFILAMPIKSALAIFMLIFYLAVMLPLANDRLVASIGLVDRFGALVRAPDAPVAEPLVPLVPVPRREATP